MISTPRQLAGVAEVVKGAGLKIRSHMGSWVRIPPPAPYSKKHYWKRVCLSKKLVLTIKIGKNALLEIFPESGNIVKY